MSRRAFLFGWKPTTYAEDRWTHLDELVSAGSGDDWWDTRSAKPQEGDQAYGIKLGTSGRGLFARGRIKEIAQPPGIREVVVHWDEFLDPRATSNLMPIPTVPTGQLWTSQSNGTEIAKFPLAKLEVLWSKHYTARTTPALATPAQADISQILSDRALSETEKRRLVQARLGQGQFRCKVALVEERCRLTGVSERTHLIASHIKPWHASTNAERLDGNNGLLLAPHVDHLFDRGFISFEGNGHLLVSPLLKAEVLKAWNIAPKQRVKAFNDVQQRYLAYHRKHVFRSRRA